jgi:hypothetical protein
MTAVKGNALTGLQADLLADLHRPVQPVTAPRRRSTPALDVEFRISPLAWRRPGLSLRRSAGTVVWGPVRMAYRVA